MSRIPTADFRRVTNTPSSGFNFSRSRSQPNNPVVSANISLWIAEMELLFGEKTFWLLTSLVWIENHFEGLYIIFLAAEEKTEEEWRRNSLSWKVEIREHARESEHHNQSTPACQWVDIDSDVRPEVFVFFLGGGANVWECEGVARE